MAPPADGRPSAWAIWIQAARPKTLWAAFAPVLIGIALAWADGVVHAPSAFLALLGAMLIQIGTNFYNDYADFLKGADTATRKGPTRATQAGWVTPKAMRNATALAFGLAVVAGGYLMWRGGWPIVIVGFSSILFGLLYTGGRYALAYLGIADLFVLVFFGPVAVGGTYYVQALGITPDVIAAGVAPGLLSVAILMVNNIRDVEEDLAAGKRTLVVRVGRSNGIWLYGLCVSLGVLWPVALYLWYGEAPWTMATVLLLPLAVRNMHRIKRETEPMALNPLLGATAQLLLGYSLVYAGALLI